MRCRPRRRRLRLGGRRRRPRVPGSGFWVLGSGFRVQGSGCRVLGSGFRGPRDRGVSACLECASFVRALEGVDCVRAFPGCHPLIEVPAFRSSRSAVARLHCVRHFAPPAQDKARTGPRTPNRNAFSGRFRAPHSRKRDTPRQIGDPFPLPE